MNINEAREANKGKVIVWYTHQIGGQLRDRWMWVAEKNGEIIDYHKKNILIKKEVVRVELVNTLIRNG